MANKMNIRIYGVVENMSYVVCPDCGKRIEIFGSDKVDKVAKDFNLKVLGKLPMDQKVAFAVDNGDVEILNTDVLKPALDEIES